MNGFLSCSPSVAAIRGLIETLMDRLSTWQLTLRRWHDGLQGYSSDNFVWGVWKHDIWIHFLLSVKSVRRQAVSCCRQCVHGWNEKIQFQMIVLSFITRTPRRSLTQILRTATLKRCTNYWYVVFIFCRIIVVTTLIFMGYSSYTDTQCSLLSVGGILR